MRLLLVLSTKPGLCVGGLSSAEADGMGLKFQNIPDEVVVLIELRKVIVTTPMNPDQSYFSGIKFLELLTMPDGN